jgi:hypothetical protein
VALFASGLDFYFGNDWLVEVAGYLFDEDLFLQFKVVVVELDGLDEDGMLVVVYIPFESSMVGSHLASLSIDGPLHDVLELAHLVQGPLVLERVQIELISQGIVAHLSLAKQGFANFHLFL